MQQTSTPLPKTCLFEENQKIFTKYNYSFLFKYNKIRESEFSIQISKNLNQVYWERLISKEQLLTEDKNWNCFEDDQDIINYIYDEIDAKDTEFDVTDKSLNIHLKFKIIKGKRETVCNLNLSLETKKSDYEFTLQQVSDNVTSINYELNQIKDKVSSNNIAVQQLTDLYQELTTKFEKMVDKSISNEEKITSLADQLHKTNNELSTVIQELAFIKQNIIKCPNVSKIITSFNKIDHENILFTNGNKTIQKISGDPSWQGFFCSDKIEYEGIREFSIKIDNINKSSIFIFLLVESIFPFNFIYKRSN